jgi:hypothetical protein
MVDLHQLPGHPAEVVGIVGDFDPLAADEAQHVVTTEVVDGDVLAVDLLDRMVTSARKLSDWAA